jgi:hypothetical protein
MKRMNSQLPLAYRWFLAKGLTNWQPWYFLDTEPRDIAVLERLKHEFQLETAADFEVYLFARRQDMDDFAFFVMKDGVIEDKVVCIHLSFAGKLELQKPLRYDAITRTFMQWVREIVLPEVEDWMSKEDLNDE